MKTPLLVLMILLGLGTAAQPVLQNGDLRPPVGFTVPVSMSGGATSPGPSGANQVWNFAQYNFTVVGQSTTIAVASSPFASNFPNANYCTETNLGGSMVYTYQAYTATKMEELAAFITSPGTGQDYSPNPVTRLIFPMGFGDSVTDTWQKVGHDPNPVTITYDGWGVFAAPSGNYMNTIRIANDYGNNEVDYSWYTTDPLRLLAVHKHSDNSLILFNDASTGIASTDSPAAASLYPNPASGSFTVRLGEVLTPNTFLDIYTLTGQCKETIPLVQMEQIVDCKNYAPGCYFYRIRSPKRSGWTGKILIQ